jgi:hypothetical protein
MTLCQLGSRLRHALADGAEAILGLLRKQPCTHPNKQAFKWLSDDGTPMLTRWCPDCGWHDEGHVHADPETWLPNKKAPQGEVPVRETCLAGPRG